MSRVALCMLASAISCFCWITSTTGQVAVDKLSDPATKLFDKYDVNHDGILSVDELAAYELGENAKYNDPDFRKLKGFKDIAAKKARQDAIDEIAIPYGRRDPAAPGGYAVNRDDFRAYLLKTNPKVKASLAESRDFLSRLFKRRLKGLQSPREQVVLGAKGRKIAPTIQLDGANKWEVFFHDRWGAQLFIVYSQTG